MAYTSEIEKLEARYRENPKGRNFAPLADAYRKAGLVDNAIELCQAGLQLHPDYVSGHIVLGRCLVDKKDDTGAEAVFRKVLDLDPENILALRVLAEISERNGRFGAAAEWLNRLLLADPMNGEAADGLSRVRGKAAAQPPPPEPVPEEVAVPELALEPEPEPITVEEPVATRLGQTDEKTAAAPAPDASLVVEHEELELKPADAAAQRRLSIEYMEGPFDTGIAEAPTASMEKPEFELERTSEPPAGASIQPFDGVDFQQVADVGSVEGIVLDEESALAPDPEVQVEGLARTQYEGSGMFRLDNAPPSAPPSAPAEPTERPTSPVDDLPLIMPEEIDSPPAPWPDAARPSRETEPLEALPVPVAAAAPLPFRLPDDDGAADTAALSQAEPVVTETMAELYLRQGHREEALQVYQALAAQRPGDARLRRKVAELSAPPQRGRTSGSGQTAGAFLKGILSARPGAPVLAPEPEPEPPPMDLAPSPADAPQAQANGPVGRLEPEAPAPGTPTRPASDTISLDSVFGDEGGHGSVPALPDAAPAQPARLPVASGGFSFDDFFGTAAVPSAGAAGKPAGSRPSRPSGRNRSPEQEEDLDQFQAWLKSLKA